MNENMSTGKGGGRKTRRTALSAAEINRYFSAAYGSPDEEIETVIKDTCSPAGIVTRDDEEEKEALMFELDDEEELAEEHERLAAEELERRAMEEVRNPLLSYLREAGGISLLTHFDEKRIAEEIETAEKRLADARERKDPPREIGVLEKEVDELKNRIIEANLRLVINIAKKYHNSKLTLRDLIQEGNIGLMKAVDKFSFRKGYKFSTYATWWIRQAITRSIADHSATIRIPVHMREKINRLNKEARQLTHLLDRDPTPEEISRRLRIAPEKVRLILKSMQQEPISMETPLGDDDKTSIGNLIPDRNAQLPSDTATYALLQEELKKLFNELDEREEKIIRLRFGIDAGYARTLEEVGQIFNLTRERIRQIECKALEKLRKSDRLDDLVSFLKWYRNATA